MQPKDAFSGTNTTQNIFLRCYVKSTYSLRSFNHPLLEYILRIIGQRCKMKIAVAVWNGLVSSVFDFAHQLLVVDMESQTEKSRTEISLEQQQGPQRVSRLVDLGVNVLICGAISRPLASMLATSNIEVIPFVSGPVDEVLNAYLNGRLAEPRFLQPGCWPGARRHFCRGWGRGHGHGWHGGRR